MPRRPDALLLAIAALLAAVSLARLPDAFRAGNALNHVSGAWLALAVDLADGILYRPIHDPVLGYGGTRNFPLFFALEAGLVRLGAEPLAAGLATSALSAALALAGAYALLRRLALPPAGAAAFAALAFGSFAAQHGIAAARGDVLAVGLSLLGLAAAGGAAPRRGALALAAALFGLAFAAKPTALTAPAAACAALALRGELRAAAGLAGGTLAGALAVVAGTQALSEGRFLALLAACASAGAGLADVLRAPLRLAGLFAGEDPAALLAFVAAVLALGYAWRRGALPVLPAAWLAAAALVLLAVLGSPGTGVNHLVELQAASAVALGAAAARAGAPGRLARLAAPAVAAAGLAVAAGLWRADRDGSRLEEIRAVVSRLPAGPLLSEDPLVPLLAGEVPHVLDPFMLRLAAGRDPDLARPLEADAHAGRFAAVVLYRDLAAPDDGWFESSSLGAGPVAALRDRYRLAFRAGRYFVHVPAPVAPAAPTPAHLGPEPAPASGGLPASAAARPAGG